MKDFFRGMHRRMALLMEAMFWRRWIKTGGANGPVLIEHLLDPLLPFPDFLRPFVDHHCSDNISVLDVGAGPCTHIGRQHPSKKITVTATDVLALSYKRLLSEQKMVPPVETVYADAEALTDVFAPASFDLVVANNSIDHCESPVKAVAEMLDMARPGCFVIMRHRENEAKRTRYRGLHEWNFSVVGGRPFLWRQGEEVDIEGAFASRASVDVIPESGHVFIALKKKK